MDGQLVTVIVSGLVSLISAFGSILLKDHLDQRREARKTTPLVQSSPAPPSRVARSPAPDIGVVGVRPRRSRTAVVALSIATLVSGWGLGTLTRETSNRIFDLEPDVIALVVLVLTTFALLGFYLRQAARSPIGYQLSALTLWSSFFAGYASAGRGWSENVTLPFLVFWGGAVMLGVLAFAVIGAGNRTADAARSRR